MESRIEVTFRDYKKEEENPTSTVAETYKRLYSSQTTFFGKSMREIYATAEGYVDANGKHVDLTIFEIFKLLELMVDESDPDTSLPQTMHAMQTGEEVRTRMLQGTHHLSRMPIKNLFTATEWSDLSEGQREFYDKPLNEFYPDLHDVEWLPLIGFIHDLGKVLATKQMGELKQEFVVGDTSPTGAPLAEASVFFQAGFHKANPDFNTASTDETMHGQYAKKCGLRNVMMTWGHDEYLYQVLKRNENRLPPEALYIIRFHSFYAWHTPRNGERGYTELADEFDWRMLPLLKAFQQCDLYSKTDELLEFKELEREYVRVIKEYFPLKQVGCEPWTPRGTQRLRL